MLLKTFTATALITEVKQDITSPASRLTIVRTGPTSIRSAVLPEIVTITKESTSGGMTSTVVSEVPLQDIVHFCQHGEGAIIEKKVGVTFVTTLQIPIAQAAALELDSDNKLVLSIRSCPDTVIYSIYQHDRPNRTNRAYGFSRFNIQVGQTRQPVKVGGKLCMVLPNDNSISEVIMHYDGAPSARKLPVEIVAENQAKNDLVLVRIDAETTSVQMCADAPKMLLETLDPLTGLQAHTVEVVLVNPNGLQFTLVETVTL